MKDIQKIKALLGELQQLADNLSQDELAQAGTRGVNIGTDDWHPVSARPDRFGTKNTNKTSKTKVSFEFFAPKSIDGLNKLVQVQHNLSRFNPEFYSVTYGAGGSTREYTQNAVRTLSNHGVIAPHLSCVGDTKAHLGALLDEYHAEGIRHIVALRGDMPSGQRALGELPYAADLVEFIKSRHPDFAVYVAAYPEMHPQASSFNDDVRHFITKARSGASAAITQFFYHPDAYFHFVDQVQKHGVDIDIIAGIMPITNTQLLRFADGTGADIPRFIRKQLQSYGDDKKSIEAFGHEVVLNLCQKLIDGGAPRLHVYTMNQDAPSARILDDLSLI